MVLGKRKPLSQVQRPDAAAASSGSSRADKLKEWKRQKATAEQENIGKHSDNAEQRLKEYKRKATQAETKRKELELKLVEALRKTASEHSSTQTISPLNVAASQQTLFTREDLQTLEELVQNTKTSNETLQKQLQQQSAELFESENYCNVLKKALRTAIDSNEQLEKKVKELTEENRVIPRQQSHLTEVSLLYKIQCIERDSVKSEMEELQLRLKDAEKAATLPPQLSRIPTVWTELECVQAESAALEQELDVFRASAESRRRQNAMLRFNSSLLQQQVAQVYEDGREAVEAAHSQNQIDMNASKKDMQEFIDEMQQQMTQGLQKSGEKIREYKRQVMRLTRENWKLSQDLEELRSTQEQ